MKNIRKSTPTFIVAMLIFILSVIPGKTMDAMGMDNETYHLNGHFLMYGLLALSLWYNLNNKGKALLATITYGTLMEILQLGIPNRAFEIKDILINSLGGLIALVIPWKKLQTLWKRHAK